MESRKLTTSISDEELTRLAVQKILDESKMASFRAEHEGASGWQPRKKSINRNFLNNTLIANAQFNKRKEK